VDGAVGQPLTMFVLLMAVTQKTFGQDYFVVMAHGKYRFMAGDVLVIFNAPKAAVVILAAAINIALIIYQYRHQRVQLYTTLIMLQWEHAVVVRARVLIAVRQVIIAVV